jgi:uncharacterized RDD family membrane protein YckC
MEKIGFGPRLVAYVIDSLIIGGVSGLITSIFAAANNDLVTMLGSLVVVVFVFWYYIYFWTTKGQTPGKLVMKIKVVATDGSQVTAGKAFLRVIGYLISNLIFALGFIWILFDTDKQGWHDKIAGTYVVRA